MYDERNLDRLKLISDKLDKIFSICKIGIIKDYLPPLKERIDNFICSKIGTKTECHS
ncbi:hypothetical protein [Campylobacter fetus]|uniref:hypothetical protein n=1 Tax=Campylobacter fetus TaxID=196 RepID=UPI001300F657|nr:hypothetical protein [Campylobacter fetus]